jgi:hypothetical protein
LPTDQEPNVETDTTDLISEVNDITSIGLDTSTDDSGEESESVEPSDLN